MIHTSTLDVLLRWFAGSALILMIGFLCFGWVKGIYWEQEMKLKRRHSHR